MNILYICTHNRCRSVLSEAITRQKAGDKINVMSAGSSPVGQVHPLSIKYLEQAGYNTESLSSKSWNELTCEGKSFEPDVVVTVCDNAAGEVCPLWLGNTPKLHWGLIDPSKLAENGEANPQAEKAFLEVIATIESRVDNLLKIAELPKDMQIKALKQLIG